MTVFVIHDGKLVEKDSVRRKQQASSFPTPMLSRFEAYASPIDDRPITSWRQRDRDLEASGSYDRRDLPKDHVDKKGRANGQRATDITDSPDIWK